MGIHYDFWFGDTKRDADRVTVSFYPNDGLYRGLLFKGYKAIGDFWSIDSVAIEKAFPGIFGV